MVADLVERTISCERIEDDTPHLDFRNRPLRCHLPEPRDQPMPGRARCRRRSECPVCAGAWICDLSSMVDA